MELESPRDDGFRSGWKVFLDTLIGIAGAVVK